MDKGKGQPAILQQVQDERKGMARSSKDSRPSFNRFRMSGLIHPFPKG